MALTRTSPKQALAQLPGLDPSQLDPATVDQALEHRAQLVSDRLRREDERDGLPQMYPSKYSPEARTLAMLRDVDQLLSMADEGSLPAPQLQDYLRRAIATHPEPGYAVLRDMLQTTLDSVDGQVAAGSWRQERASLQELLE